MSEHMGGHRRDSVMEQTGHLNSFQKALLCCKYGAMNSLERYFRWHGRLIARQPAMFIFLSVIVTIVCGLGLIGFYEESDMTALWVPKGSKLRNNVEWVQQNFPQQLRFNQVIFKADNVLTPEVLQEMFNLTVRMREVTHDNQTWQDVCFRVPVVTKPKCFDPSQLKYLSLFGKRRKRDLDNDDWFEEDFELDDLTDETYNHTDVEVDDECQDFKMPELSFSQIASLIPLAERIEKYGFTPELADEVSLNFYPEPYCSLVDHAPTVCYEESILELWANDGDFDEDSENTIVNLTTEEIIESVNTRNLSGIFLREKNFKNVLGDISYNESGHIIGAKVATLTWVGKVNLTALKQFGSVQRGDIIDKYTFDYEGAMIEVATDRNNLGKGVEIFVNIHRMLFESMEGQVFKDIGMLILGYLIVFIYVLIMLGKCDCVEQKVFLSIGGILGVAMGIIVSYGLCSAFGFFYSAAHTVMPFLLLGIGIDDMFVIVQCLNTLSEKEKSKSVEDRIGATMAHAGVAITITSVTNFIAFGIGASSSLPALRSFCVYASIGIIIIFSFQTTWFVALLAIDEYRVEAHRNGCCCCFIHSNRIKPDTQETRSPGKTAKVFKIIAEALITGPVKIGVVLSTAVLLVIGVYGMAQLKMEFRPEWLMDPAAEVTNWYFAHKEYFPSDGEGGQLYLRSVNYSENFLKLDNLINNLEEQSDIIKYVDSWHREYKKFAEEAEEVDWENITEEYFLKKLTQFLYSPRGAKYKNQFKFSSNLECGQLAPSVLVSSINYQHMGFESASEWVPAMDRVNLLVEDSNISSTLMDNNPVSTSNAVFPLAVRYSNWETDKVIGSELYQNMVSSLLAIFLTVLIFLGSLRGACIVIFCVAATIIEVAGFMHFWGLTVDVISCNTLVISIGLCVDFSAHIAHGFLSVSGDRNQRVTSTFTKIGPAVLNGGLSTMLAFILLSTSESYVCLSFFKIFFLICLFGLYHGLIALPVILAIAGPLPQVIEVGPEDVDEYALYSRYSVPESKGKTKGRSVSICREAPTGEDDDEKKG
eukprot:GFUD01044108.1.p1 GENE.GFUD01044108.1~~GFUD01044108.1.p1  ORF type:complete len:1044 (-),score=198.42 GFUD01044108.1:97-3228(-)